MNQKGIRLFWFVGSSVFVDISLFAQNTVVLKERVVRGLEVAQNKIRSAQCTITLRAKNANVPLKDQNGIVVPPMPEKMVTVVATKGRKSYTENTSTAPVTSRTIYDGKQAYMSTSAKIPNPDQPMVWQATRAGAGGVKEWMYDLFGKNVLDLLKAGQFKNLTSSSSPDYGEVVTVTFDPRKDLAGIPLRTVSVDLAPTYGFAVVKMRTDGLVTQQITKFVRKEGIALPLQAKRTFYITRGGQTRSYRSETIIFSGLQVNNVPDTLFVINIKPGDVVQENGTRYTVGPNGERVRQ